MGTEVLMTIIAVIGGVASFFLLKYNAQIVKKERDEAINLKIQELGGEIIKVEHVDRQGCPYSDYYRDPDHMYKFYRIRYEVSGQRKMAYAILILKQNWFGPSLVAEARWSWHT